MGANDRAVAHQILIAAISRQRLEDTLPDTGMTPAAEALMDRLPLAVRSGRSRQCAPERNTHRQPLMEQAVVSAAPAGIVSLAG
jgi:hypothetical protein